MNLNSRYLLLYMILVFQTTSCQINEKEVRNNHFPLTLLWGVTTAAYQNEGGIQNDWSISGVDAGSAVAHSKNFHKDVGHMKKMGLTAYRFSIEWAKIEPEPGKWNQLELERYRKQIHQLKQVGIEPFVTLWHFTQPPWIAKNGGWKNIETIEAYKRYVKQVVLKLGPDVKWWITLNEPMVYAIMAYYKGIWPPFHQQRSEMDLVLNNLIQAHAEAYQLIHRLDPDAKVSLAQNQAYFVPLRKWHPGDQIANSVYSRAYNYSLWNTVFQSGFSFPFDWSHIQGLANSMDWLAINYYSQYSITLEGRPLAPDGQPATYSHRKADPEGFFELLKTAGTYAKAHNIPIFITENGWSKNQERSCYLVEHLAQVNRAIQMGIPIQGYFHWTLMDNFEWTEGYRVTFGLLDRQRKWKPTAYLYQQIIAQKKLPTMPNCSKTSFSR
jgi:beta-glucosidase